MSHKRFREFLESKIDKKQIKTQKPKSQAREVCVRDEDGIHVKRRQAHIYEVRNGNLITRNVASDRDLGRLVLPH